MQPNELKVNKYNFVQNTLLLIKNPGSFQPIKKGFLEMFACSNFSKFELLTPNCFYVMQHLPNNTFNLSSQKMTNKELNNAVTCQILLIFQIMEHYFHWKASYKFNPTCSYFYNIIFYTLSRIIRLPLTLLAFLLSFHLRFMHYVHTLYSQSLQM